MDLPVPAFAGCIALGLFDREGGGSMVHFGKCSACIYAPNAKDNYNSRFFLSVIISKRQKVR